MLGHGVHLGNSGVDLLDTIALFLTRRRDLGDDVGDMFHGCHDLREGLAGLVDEFRALVYLIDTVLNQVLDFLGRGGAAAGQIAHFGGYHGEAAALLSSPRRLNSCIQCQQVGLEGDFVDDRDDIGNLLAGRRDGVHSFHRILNHVPAFLGMLGRFSGQSIRTLGIFGILAHRGRHLLHAGSGLFKVGRLLLGALGEVGVALGNFLGAVEYL